MSRQWKKYVEIFEQCLSEHHTQTVGHVVQVLKKELEPMRQEFGLEETEYEKYISSSVLLGGLYHLRSKTETIQKSLFLPPLA